MRQGNTTIGSVKFRLPGPERSGTNGFNPERRHSGAPERTRTGIQ